jgi:hypothetical protein
MPITFNAGQNTNSSASGTGTGTINANSQSVSVNTLIVIYGDNQSGSTPTPGFTDNVNSGSYTVLPLQTDGSRVGFVAFMVCNASGTLSTISYTNMPNGSSNGWVVLTFNGFAGTPTYAGSGNYTTVFNTGSTSTAVAGTSYNTNFNSQLNLGFVWDLGGSTWSPAPAAPWTNPTTGGTGNSPANISSSYRVDSSAGTAIQITGTLTPADFWIATQVGFYDQGNSLSSLSPFNLGPG